jgi:hypothetical protein
MVMSPARLRMRNECAGEDQQQFTRPDKIGLLNVNSVAVALRHETRRVCISSLSTLSDIGYRPRYIKDVVGSPEFQRRILRNLKMAAAI